MTFPADFHSVDIGHYIAREAEKIASQIIDQAKKDLTQSAHKLSTKGWAPDDVEPEIVYQSRKKVKAAFKEFEIALEEKYKNSQDGRVTAIMGLAILDGKTRFFDTRLEEALADVMNQALGKDTHPNPSPLKNPPKDPPGGSPPNMIKV